MGRLDWSQIVGQAAEIVKGYDTGVTLRQLFYRLVSTGVLPNTTSAYKTLSARTAEARRDNGFPSLLDRTRRINRLAFSESPRDALTDLLIGYRRDHTEGQPWSVYLGVEKNAIVEQLWQWFGSLGFPILALGGYSSQTYVDDVQRDVGRRRYICSDCGGGEDGGRLIACENDRCGAPRRAVLIYAGDFDPSGEDIDRDFEERTNGSFDEVVRIALNPEQVEHYDLPPQPGKASDTRAEGFVARHGRLVQVELDALPPDVLRSLYQETIDRFWDRSKYEAVIEREERERQMLRDFGSQWVS